MPVYVYKNLKTGETFELAQRITEGALSNHPETGDPVKRLIQPVGIAFKGSGFYVTDSRKSSPSKPKTDTDTATSDSKSDSKSDGKSDSTKAEGSSPDTTKTESAKSETKPEAKPKSESKPTKKSASPSN